MEKKMKNKKFIALLVGLTISMGGALVPLTSAAAAPAGNVIAQDIRNSITVVPGAARALTVTAAPGSKVTITQLNKDRAAKKSLPLTKTTGKTGTVTLTKLVAGTQYSVRVGAQSVVATPVIFPTPARSLSVATTEAPGNVDLSWKHQNTRAQGVVRYRIDATPIDISENERTKASMIIESMGLQTTLIGLDPTLRYQFSVTPVNDLGTGTSSVAVMARSLNQIDGVVNPPITTTPKPEVQPVPQSAPRNESKPAPAPAPAPAPEPKTKTIYVCPAGYFDTGTLCETYQDYTYNTNTETRGYTYHNESVIDTKSVSATFDGTNYHWSCPSGYDSGGGQWGVGVCKGSVDVQIKDSAPAGFTDNGSNWTKTTQTRNAGPASYTDNGTKWVKTVAKEARVIPA